MKEVTLSWALKETADLTGREGSVEEGFSGENRQSKQKCGGQGTPLGLDCGIL